MTDALTTDTAVPDTPDDSLDTGRRKLLAAATGIAGGAGIAAASIPFVVSMMPSERARAGGAPIDVEFARLEPGEQLTAEWRGKPVWILRRTGAMLKALEDPNHRAKLADPDSRVKTQQPEYAVNAFRSARPEYLVVPPHRYLDKTVVRIGEDPVFRAHRGDRP